MIQFENNCFYLATEHYSCILTVDKYGCLRQNHFGPVLAPADAQALVYRSGLGWGSSVLLGDPDTDSCMDVFPLSWSDSGRGDFRESPLELSTATNLRYESHAIIPGAAPISCSLPQAHGGLETLEITMTQPGLELRLYFTLFETAMTRRAVLKNTGEKPVAVQKLMSFMMDLPGDFEITTFDGGWCAEMRKHVSPVSQHRTVNESTTGASSNRHNPGFLLSRPGATEDSGLVYGFNLIYSGNHYASAQQSLQGLTRVMQGISPANFSMTLEPGESFETPEAILCCSDEGFDGLSRNMHPFILNHIIPDYWNGRPRPVLYNDWEGCMFKFDQSLLLRLARKAKDLGCELFVLDDGWFGQRNSDTAGLGDYNVNTKKLPGGIKGLADKVRALGMEFGLWFEPESVNPDSNLYRAHPDWALTDEFPPLLGRHQLLLDLTKPEVRDYIVENVSKIIDEAGITYVKWDMNRHSVALGLKAHRYILGLYEVLDRIFTPRPQVLLESCSSGGNRFDPGMLCYGPQVWCSDDTDPIERLTIQENLSYLYPQSTFGAHVSASPHAQTLRATPLSTRGNVSFFGCLGYELDLSHLLPVEEKEIREQIALYKEYRQVFQFGSFRRGKNLWQVSDEKTTLAGVFHRCRPAVPGWEFLQVKGLKKEALYRFRSRPQNLRIGQFGDLVKHVAPVNLNPNGVILRTADHHATMPDGVHEGTASGAALSFGIPMLPAFRGTGYDENQRTQLDFGSNLYIIEEENEP